jgi:predicted dehydrogenase
VSQGINRRQFLSRGVASGVALKWAMAAPAAWGEDDTPPEDRLAIGVIGVGARSPDLVQGVLAAGGTEVVGVCDAYRGRVERALYELDGKARDYGDYRRILEDPGIDAVIIATPDHLHKRQVVEALQAGKDVYCEKPLTYAIDEGLEIVRAVEASGRILQVGSQGISSTIQRRARDLIASGRLGKITMIRASYNRNTAEGAWIYPIPPDASPETVDWESFLGDAPMRPFDLARFFRWRCYSDYSGGIATDLFVHLCTTIHFLMGARMPKRVLAAGQLYRWTESRDVPDTLNGILEYPEGFTVNISSTFNNQSSSGAGFEILGTEGSLRLGDGIELAAEHPVEGNAWVVRTWPRELEDAYWADPEVQKRERPDTWPADTYTSREVIRGDGPDSTQLHLERFVRAVRTREQPEEDALTGHRAAACAHLVNLSAARGTGVEWDFDRETLRA